MGYMTEQEAEKEINEKIEAIRKVRELLISNPLMNCEAIEKDLKEINKKIKKITLISGFLFVSLNILLSMVNSFLK